MQLLFCSTYSFETQGSSGNWAVVKFPCMIAVDEIRIIPPGSKAHSQLHEEHFVGQTSPTKFRVEFFSDDRSASMTTYEHVGSLDYVEGSPNRFHPSSALYSEKLLLNGWFTQITFAVYGGILSEVGLSAPPTLDLNMKTPSLIIHGKPEGRSVYIRGMPDVPQLTKDIEKPASLLDPLPGVTDDEFLIGRGAKNYLGMDENIGRRQMEDLRLQEGPGLGGDLGGSFYDRHQPRDRGFGSDVGRFPRKPYANEETDYQIHPRNVSGRKTLLPDGPDGPFRPDFSGLGPYKDKSRGFPHQRSHARHETIDNSDLSKKDSRERGSRSYDSHGDGRENLTENTGENDKVRDLRENLRRNKAEDMEYREKEGQQDWMDGEYEEISDEEIEDERVAAMQDMEDIVSAEILSQTSMMCFNPFMMEPGQLVHFNHPDMTDFEISYSNRLLRRHAETPSDQETAPDKLRRLIEKWKNIIPAKTSGKDFALGLEQGKELVAALEEISALVTTGLPGLFINPQEKYEHIPLLVAWTSAALDNKLLSSQAVGTNLRMLKAGINLAHNLCLSTQEIVSCLSDNRLDERLLALLSMDNMASSVKILIIHALDAYLSWPSSLNAYFSRHDTGNNKNHGPGGYDTLVGLLLTPQAARVVTALSRLLNKVKLFHSMFKLKLAVQTLVESKIPNAEDEYDFYDDYLTDENESDVVEEEIVLEEEEMMVMSSTSNDEDDDMPANDEIHFHEPPPSYTSKNIRSAPDAYNRPLLQEKLSSEPEPTAGGGQAILLPEDTTIPLEAAICFEDVSLTQGDVDEIIECLNLLKKVAEDVKGTIMQLPRRSFPTHINFNQISAKDAKSSFFRMMEFFHVLPSIQALLTLPVVSAVQDIYEIAYTFLDVLMSNQDGLLFLASNSKIVISISKHLLSSAAVLSTAEVETPGTAAHLGAKLAFHVQAILCMDQLQGSLDENVTDPEDAENSMEVLKMLYSLTYPSFGKHWLAHILSLESHILPLLGCIHLPKVVKVEEKNEEDKETKEKETMDEEESPLETKKRNARKSAATGFSVNILLGMLKLSPNVSYLMSHSDTLNNVMKKVVTSRAVEEANEWLRPLETLGSDKGDIVVLMEFVKTGFEKLEWNTLLTSGPGLCTALRLLCHLTQAENPYTIGAEEKSGRKSDPESYHSALQVFSAGGLSVLVTAMEQLNKCFRYPCFSQHSLTTVFSYNFQNVVGAISESLLILINHLLKLLLGTAEGKFKEGQLTKQLTELYAGMYTTLRETNLARMDVTLELIVSIFSVLIAKLSESNQDSDADEHSKILEDILRYIQERCYSIVPGMILLSHLLPLPLPLVLQENDFSDTDIQAVLSVRGLWENRLKNFMEPLSSFVSTLCHSTCLPLLDALVPVVQQVVDLSPKLATMILSTIADSCATVEKPKESTPPKDDAPVTDPPAQKTMWHVQPIHVLSEIIAQPSAKATLLSLLHDNEKHILKQLWVHLQEHGRKSTKLTTAAANLANVLLNPDITFIPSDDVDTLEHSCLANVVLMASAGLESPSLNTASMCLICLTMALSTEYGFTQTRSALVKHPSVLNTLLDRIVRIWDVDIAFAVDVLHQFCVFINELMWPLNNRQSVFSKAEIKSTLKWNKEFATHPLLKLKAKLEKTPPSEENFEQTLDNLTILCQTLKTTQKTIRQVEDKSKKKENDARENRKPLPLAEQFKRREVWVYGEDDEAFSTRFGILSGNTRTAQGMKSQKGDTVKVSLIEIAEKFCSGFNLENSLKELTESAKTIDIDKIRMEAKAKRLKKLETFSTRHGKTLTFIKRSHGLMGMPTRGRGRGRGGPVSGRHYDLFRQRKQNTSRPPSMHVDDFVAADEEDLEFPAPQAPPPPSQFIPSRRTSRPFKRDFNPRGRGGRGANRGLGRGGFNNFGGADSNSGSPTGFDKFRNKPIGNRSQERFPRGRGRGRDPNRSSFSPREGFKNKPPSSWSTSPRNFGFASGGGFRGGRGNKLMAMGRPLLPPPPMVIRKWGGMPPPRRGRGYGKPRGKHIRSFTR